MSGSLAVAGQRITAAWLNQNIPGPWQVMTLQSSWTVDGTYVTPQYRLFNSVTVEIIGVMTGGVITNGTTITTLPTGYLPMSEQGFAGTIWTPAEADSSFELVAYPDGTFRIYNVTAGTTALGFHGFVSLDA